VRTETRTTFDSSKHPNKRTAHPKSRPFKKLQRAPPDFPGTLSTMATTSEPDLLVDEGSK
jgi:hypothetical protein